MVTSFTIIVMLDPFDPRVVTVHQYGEYGLQVRILFEAWMSVYPCAVTVDATQQSRHRMSVRLFIYCMTFSQCYFQRCFLLERGTI